MKKMEISVTQAARNFAECVNRAHYQKMSFVLLKNGKALARLVPESEKVCKGADLAAAVASAELSPAEARAWHEDLVRGRSRLSAPKNKWQ